MGSGVSKKNNKNALANSEEPPHSKSNTIGDFSRTNVNDFEGGNQPPRRPVLKLGQTIGPVRTLNNPYVVVDSVTTTDYNGLYAKEGTTTSVGIAVDQHGNIVFPDITGGRIRLLTPTGNGSTPNLHLINEGVVVTIAGTGLNGFNDGPAGIAQFNRPKALAIDTVGNIIVSDTTNHKIRKIAPDGFFLLLSVKSSAKEWFQHCVGVEI